MSQTLDAWQLFKLTGDVAPILGASDQPSGEAPAIGGEGGRTALEAAAAAVTGSDEPEEPTEPETPAPDADAPDAPKEGETQDESPPDAPQDEVERSEWFASLDADTQRYVVKIRKENRDRRVTLEEYTKYGTPEDLAALADLQTRIADPDFRLQEFLATGQQLGLPLSYLTELITDGPKAARGQRGKTRDDDGYEFDDDTPADGDRPLTRAEFERMQGEQELRRGLESRQAKAVETMDEALKGIGISEDDELRREAVLTRAGKYVPEGGTLEPTLLRNAIKRAWDDLSPILGGASNGNGAGDGNGSADDDDYPRQKATAAAKTPATLKGGRGSGVPAGPTTEPPADLEEGFKRARERFRREGVM